jgi:transglutaminase-like putative cysteine protease
MKKLSALIITFLLLMTHVPQAMAAASDARIIADDAAEGRIRVACPLGEARVKVLVEKDGSKYYYDMIDNEETLPLQMGDGAYKVTVYQNTTGNRYRAVLSQNVTVEMDSDREAFLQSVQAIEWTTDMEAIRKAQALTKGLKTDEEKVAAIHKYIVKNFSYDHSKVGKLASDYLPNVEQTFSDRKGICYDYASLLAAMTRSVGIPAKLVKGYTPNANGYHAWNEVYLNDQWVTLDATYDSQMDDLGGKYAMIKDSGLYDKVYEY